MVKEFGRTKLILFGSALEEPENVNDLELACDGMEGWKFCELRARREELIAAPVDLVPLSSETRFTIHMEKRVGLFMKFDDARNLRRKLENE